MRRIQDDVSGSNFLCGRSREANPLHPPSTDIHLSLTPLCVDIING